MADVLRVDAASILPAIWHPMYGGLLARTWLKVSAPLRNALKSSSPISVLWLVFSAVSWSASTRFPKGTKPTHTRWLFRFADVFEPLRASCSLLLVASIGDLWLPVRNPQAVPAEPPLVPMAPVRPNVPAGLMGSLSPRPAGALRPKEIGIPQPARILLPAGNPRAFLISFSSRCGTTGSPPRSLHTARRRTAPIKTGKLSSGVGISLVIIHRFRIFRHIPRLH